MSQDKPVLTAKELHRKLKVLLEDMQNPCYGSTIHNNTVQDFTMLTLKYADMIVEALSARQGWISVEERLPNPLGDDEYLVATGTGFVTALMFDKDGWRQDSAINDGDDYWNRHVTHWMPLPPPPHNDHEPPQEKL